MLTGACEILWYLKFNYKLGLLSLPTQSNQKKKRQKNIYTELFAAFQTNWIAVAWLAAVTINVLNQASCAVISCMCQTSVHTMYIHVPISCQGHQVTTNHIWEFCWHNYHVNLTIINRSYAWLHHVLTIYPKPWLQKISEITGTLTC